MSAAGVIGWEGLRHGGLLLDAQRLKRIGEIEPQTLSPYLDRELRRQAVSIIDGGGDVPAFVTFVLKDVCGFSESEGRWQRGSNVSSEWGRVAITGETIKPRQLWEGSKGSVLPVFFDSEKRIGLGRGKRATSQVLQWLRAGSEKLALITNGRQWRLIFAGLDFDAWCEWDLDLWFEEGELSLQVTALRTVFSPALWTPAEKDERAPLLQAIQDSRKGQAELSAVLGERVREAVELVVQSHGEVLKERCSDVDPAEIYRAAVRMVMRLVVVLFAESRELLPRDNALYHGAYGLSGLIEELEKAAARGGNRLARSWNAWPRVLALFQLVYQGSHHPALPVPAYGGDLFAPGNADSIDGLVRVLAVLESACFERELMPDRDVHRMLERITRTRVKIRQGRASTWVPSPVDFSDLSSEYIGILYEGLLDFELKTAPAGDPMVFLAIGNQPALPLSSLEAMDDKMLASLLEKVKDTSKGDEEEESEEVRPADEEDATDESPTRDEENDALTIAETEEPEPDDSDARHVTRTRAEIWARRAVEVGKLVRKPRGMLTPEKRLAYEDAVARSARQLVVRVLLPGEWYLVRWGGTRKGSGTFYTCPGLAVPMVHRTLRPLAYAPPSAADGAPVLDAPPVAWIPKTPEEILALKICDTASGSGTFPVATLRFLTEALYASLHYHGRISEDGDRVVVRLLAGTPAFAGAPEEHLGQELLPCRPDDPLFEPRLKAILRRHVVERCIYGVDLDPLAVELCRLALWIETMDRTLPFSFLDHKIKCGNALVGAWFNQFQHYPVMAWKNREGGDKSHRNGVHFEKEVHTKAIKAFLKDRLVPDLRRFLEGRTLFSQDLQQQAAGVHTAALATLARLHDLPVHDSEERARIYREELVGSAAYRSLKEAMDLWCACWFWPADALEQAPLPTTLAAPPERTRVFAKDIASRKHFFHWELEFPDVFCAVDSGFDAMQGNPPWENLQPNPEEFFSNEDPLFRTYGRLVKQERQRQLFSSDIALEKRWLDYCADFNSFSHWVSYSANPFGDPGEGAVAMSDSFSIGRGGRELHAWWRNQRRLANGYATDAHPFQHQVGRLFTYKLFLEQCYVLLREGGRLGQIVPSGIYSDAWSKPLRELFLDRCQWEWLFNFINWNKIFPSIYYRFKFNAIVVQKGGATSAINTAFVRTHLEDWERAEALATPYARAHVEGFSPRSKAILEIQSPRDLDILGTIYADSALLGDEGPKGWGIKYKLEFMMNTDAHLFPPRPTWESEGYRADEYSRWLKGDWRAIGELWAELGVRALPIGHRSCAEPPYDTLPIPRADIPPGIVLSRDADAWLRGERGERVALPLYEGRMVGQFDYSQKGWVSGKGRGAVWKGMSLPARSVEPQYLMSADDFYARLLEGDSNADHAEQAPSALLRALKTVTVVDVTSATNARTVVTACCPAFPHGHSAPILICRDPLLLCSLMNSFCFDALMRFKVSGLHIVWSCLEEGALPTVPPAVAAAVRRLTCELTLSTTNGSAAVLREARAFDSIPRGWAATPHERTRRKTALEAVWVALFGLGRDELSHLLRDVDYPRERVLDRTWCKDLNPNGFWRVDKEKDPELRHTVLALVAFHDLEDKIRACGGDRDGGIEAFLAQNDGDGWMLPETLRLADHGLGHDERAREHQPVASRLGPRFYDWQLVKSPEESWRECHLHSRNLLGEAGYRQLLADIAVGENRRQSVAESATPFGEGEDGPQQTLFTR